MNKQNLGYRLGKWYRKFRQWQHPTILKCLYVLIMGAISVVFWDFVLCVFMIVFIATSGTGKIKVKKAGFREGHSGFGYYNKNNWKVF